MDRLQMKILIIYTTGHYSTVRPLPLQYTRPEGILRRAMRSRLEVGQRRGLGKPWIMIDLAWGRQRSGSRVHRSRRLERDLYSLRRTLVMSSASISSWMRRKLGRREG